MLRKWFVLRDPTASTEGGGEKATQLKPSPSSGVPHPEKQMPESLKDVTFNAAEDFEVEQLPPQKEEKVEKKEEKVETALKASKEDKVAEEKVEKKEEKKEVSILKPPTKGEEKKEAAPAKGKIIELPQKGEKVTRDYSGFSDAEVTHLKQMSDGAYKFTTELLKERKELSKLKDTTYLQDPQAYRLDPRFQKLQVDKHYAQKEADHWRNQIALIKEGKPWREIVGFDDKTGAPQFGPERSATPQDEEAVRLAMNQCFGTVSQLDAQGQQYVSKYKEAINSDMQAIDTVMKERFSWEADPKLLDYTISVDGGERSVRQIRQDIASVFPVYMQNHPAVRASGNLMVALMVAQAELASLKGAAAVTAIKEDEQEEVEPTSEHKPKNGGKGKAIHGVVEFKEEPIV